MNAEQLEHLSYLESTNITLIDTSRSLPEYTEESISNLVDKIIDSQVEEGYFRECPVTFKDIATVKAVFKEKLKTIYHTRISYPELKKQDL